MSRKYPQVSVFPVSRGLTREGKPQKARELVLLIRESRQRWSLVCFCAQSSRRKDGITCRHVVWLLEAMKLWYRARTFVQHPKCRAREGVRGSDLVAA